AKSLLTVSRDTRIAEVVSAAHQYDPAATAEFVRGQFEELSQAENPPYHLLALMGETVVADMPDIATRTIELLSTDVEANALDVLRLGLAVAVQDDATHTQIAPHIRTALGAHLEKPEDRNALDRYRARYVLASTQ